MSLTYPILHTMTTIHDPAFGDMSYDFLWEKEECLTLWGKEYTLRVEASAKSEDDPELSASQQQAYLKSKELLAAEQSSCLAALCAYCEAALGISCTAQDFLRHNHPTTLFFSLCGRWGLLFDSAYDEEDGIALMHADGRWSVGPQDILI